MKYALITGGSRGIGRAICVELSTRGIPVIINYLSNANAAAEVKDLIKIKGGWAELLQFDVSNKIETEKALDAWAEAHPDDYIGYLVNNAGIRHDRLMFMMSDEEWSSVVNTSVDGFFYVTRKLLPKMMQRKHEGSIVNIASLSGQKGIGGQTNYSAAKAALIGATKALALETASKQVRVNAVAPGFIISDMTKELSQEKLKDLIPMKRLGKPEEVAKVVAFLLSDAASYITGEIISINGGLYT